MEEKYINSTSLGRSQEKRKEHYWRNTPGKRTQDIQYRYMWYDSNGAKKFMALCRNGRVSSTVTFVHTSSSGKKSSYKEMYDGKDMSKGEFTSVAQANGGLENMINWECKDKDRLALIKYIANEDKLEKVLENPQVIKTPVVRNGK